MSINHVIIKYKLTLAGLIPGAIAGYIYYHYVGCMSGTCSITPDPLNSALYGSMMGGLFLNMFEREKEKSN